MQLKSEKQPEFYSKIFIDILNCFRKLCNHDEFNISIVVVVVVYAVTGFKETSGCVVKHTMTADEYDCCSSINHRYLFTNFYISFLC